MSQELSDLLQTSWFQKLTWQMNTMARPSANRLLFGAGGASAAFEIAGVSDVGISKWWCWQVEGVAICQLLQYLGYLMFVSTGHCMMVLYISHCHYTLFPQLRIPQPINGFFTFFHQESPSSLDSFSVADAPDQEQQLRRQVQLQEQQFQLQEMQLQQQELGAGGEPVGWDVEG